MDNFQKKIQTNSKTLYIILNILLIVIFLDIIVQIAAIFWINTSPENIVNFKVGPIPVFYPFANSLNISEQELSILIGAELIRQGFIIPILLIARSIFRDIQTDQTPFTNQQVTRLKKISGLMLLLIIIPFIAETLMTLNLSEIVKQSVQFNMTNIIFVLLFYFLSRIFDYGRILQQQSDETL